LHNSVFLVAHFHNVIIGGVVFGLMAGFNYWFPKAFGFKLDESWGRAAFWCWLVGFYVAFMPLYVLGLMGMTRRLQHYDVLSWRPWLLVAAVGAGIAWGIINTDVDYLSDLRRHALVPVFTVLSDHETIGKIQGQPVAALLSDQGCVLSLEGPSVRDLANVRTKGMLAAKPPQIVVKTLKGDWTQNSGYHAVESWLSLTTSRQLKRQRTE